MRSRDVNNHPRGCVQPNLSVRLGQDVDVMNHYGFGGSSGGGGNISATERAQMMDQVKSQIAVANAQELVQVQLHVAVSIKVSSFIYINYIMH